MFENLYFNEAKKKLVNLLKEKGITDQQVLNAFEKVDRHHFVESYLHHEIYLDKALPILYGQTISQPYTVAFQSQLLSVAKGDRILEIGTGSGFQAVILGAMGARVYTIERNLELFNYTKPKLDVLDYKIMMHYGDGFCGWPNYAPFDKIIVTCGAPSIPVQLLKQLKIGGVMIIPVGENVQIMKRITKLNEEDCNIEEFGNFRIVPMLENVQSINSINS